MRILYFFRIVFPALIGNILEWYEFAVYGYFAVGIARQFFPETDRLSSLIKTFAVFAIGFFMRPIGAVVFGYFADRLGRKKILPISIIAMAIATMAIGLIPTHEQIGIWAGLLLVFFRMIQGFAVGGEYSSSIAYIIEQTPPNKRGLLGSLTLFGAYFGLLLGSSIAALLTYLAKDTTYYAHAWRVAFVLGIFLGLLGLYIRKNMPETPEFIEAKKKGLLLKNPLKDLFLSHKRSLFLGVGMILLPAVTSWLILSYFPTFITQFGNTTEYQALTLETGTLLVALLAVPLFGYLSDRLGRFLFLFTSPILLFCFSSFLFRSLLSSSLGAVFLAQAVLAVMCVMSEAVLPATIACIFPVNQRCTGIALCVNIANGYFGGSAPLFATLLIKKTGHIYSPSWYIMLTALISLCAAIICFKMYRKLTI